MINKNSLCYIFKFVLLFFILVFTFSLCLCNVVYADSSSSSKISHIEHFNASSNSTLPNTNNGTESHSNASFDEISILSTNESFSNVLLIVIILMLACLMFLRFV